MDTEQTQLPTETEDNSPDLSGLSDEEQRLLYNVEVLNLPVKRAGEIAGVKYPAAVLKRTHVAAAREQLRAAMRVRHQLTRDDVITGMKEAIEQAKILGDPMAQIAGWREIGKLLGYDKTPSISINLHGSAHEIRKQVQGLSTRELLEISGASDVIDGDFYRSN